MQRLSESDLRNFFFQLAEDNRALQKKIVLDFSRGKPSAKEMHRYEREIDRVLASYDLLGYIEYNASKAFADKVLDYLSSTIPPLIKRSCTMEALELVNIMASNVADISFEDEDDQQLCLDECRAYWADIIGHAKTETCRSCIDGLYSRWMQSKTRAMSYTAITKRCCIMTSMTRRP